MAEIRRFVGEVARKMGVLPPRAPVNYQKRDPLRMQADVEYALASASECLRLIEVCGLKIDGLRLLELGPGTDFGAQLIVASMGAHVTIADRFLAAWDDNYHPEFYRHLASQWDGPKHHLEAVIATGTYADKLNLLEEAAEDLCSIPDGSQDMIYSNAVLEHIFDLEKVAQEMARVLRVDGRAAHQIDMRDHRDFSRPLEYLTANEGSFKAYATESQLELGNRFRSIEYWAHFESAGLQVVRRDINGAISEEYCVDALKRLRNSKSAYRCWPEDDVRRIGGRFFLVKVDGESASLLGERAKDVLNIIEALKKISLEA